jgi:hypothetical protein
MLRFVEGEAFVRIIDESKQVKGYSINALIKQAAILGWPLLLERLALVPTHGQPQYADLGIATPPELASGVVTERSHSSATVAQPATVALPAVADTAPPSGRSPYSAATQALLNW